MRTLDYLFLPELRGLYWPGVIAGLAIAILSAALSVVVVLKRLAFIGQGVSHAAFGGIGLAALLATAVPASIAIASGTGQLAVVLVFCLASGLVIAWLSRRRSTSADTAIGIVLVVSMALGAILLRWAAQRSPTRPPSWESVLFGSILEIDGPTSVWTLAVAMAMLAVLLVYRRAMLFWVFDEPAAPAFGVESDRVRLLVMVVLTIAVVLSMKLAGVVLSTALLVLPGAAALAFSNRLSAVMGLALGIALLGTAGGLVMSFELDWPPGPSIVGVLAVLYLISRLVGASRGVQA